MMIWWWLLIIVVVGVLVWSIRRAPSQRPEPRDAAEEALREQYARGEIDEETYRRRRDELRRG